MFFHSDPGYITAHFSNPRLMKNSSADAFGSCFFNCAGMIRRPFASIFHSYSPGRFSIGFDQKQCKTKNKKPLFPTCPHFVEKTRLFHTKCTNLKSPEILSSKGTH